MSGEVELRRSTNPTYSVAFCPPSWFGIVAYHYHGQSPRVFHPFVGSSVARQPGFEMVLDGPMLDALDNPRNVHGNRIYESYTKAGMLAQIFDARRGIDYAGHPSWSHQGKSLNLVNNQLVVTPLQTRATGCICSVQLFPWMVHQGQNIYPVLAGDPPREWRAGAGIHRSGRLGFLAWVGGIHRGGDLALELGFTEFGYSDGGGSTDLWVQGHQVAGPTVERRLGSVLVAQSFNVNDVNNFVNSISLEPAMEESSGLWNATAAIPLILARFAKRWL